MIKIFSTKLDVKVLKELDAFCKTHHLKKSRILEELIMEGIGRRKRTLLLTQSLERGLEDEAEGRLLSVTEVEKSIFEKRAKHS